VVPERELAVSKLDDPALLMQIATTDEFDRVRRAARNRLHEMEIPCCNQEWGRNHVWHGCKCTVCAETRDLDHVWNGRTGDECACRECGKRHSWKAYGESAPYSVSRAFYNKDSSGKSYDTDAIHEYCDVVDVIEVCELCQQRRTFQRDV
jgi:hypothetical protein